MATDKDPKKKRRRGRQSPEGAEKGRAQQRNASSSSHDESLPQSLLIKISEDAPWYELADQVPGRNGTILSDPPPSGTHGNKREVVNKYRREADELFRREIQLFGKRGDKDMSWIQSTISKGTLKDRIAAMSVVVSSHPIHKFHALDGLLQMTGCLSEGQTNSRVAQLAAEALEDLFINTFLPDDRKLIPLDQRPLYLYEQQQPQEEDGRKKRNNKKKKKSESEVEEKEATNTTKRTLSPRVLLLWRFEEMLKEKYDQFLRKYVGYTLREGTEQQKIPTLRLAATLFKSIPEGEAVLLPMLSNKLGDPAKKVASTAAHELRNVLLIHPAMQTVVAREVQQLAHRPHLSSRALYNCITFLNQLRFSHHDRVVEDDEEQQQESASTGETDKKKTTAPKKKPQTLPASLISTYFRLFEVTVNKASKDEDASTMKGRLLSALLAGVNRAHPYLPPKDQEMEEHVDALYRVVHKAPAGACTQALLLLFHLAVGSKLDDENDHGDDDNEGESRTGRVLSDQEKSRQDRFYQTLFSRLRHAELLRSGKHLTMLFNLIFKSMKYDRNETRVVAFAKQILATTMHCTPPVVAATTFLLNEVAKFHPVLATCFSSTLGGADSTRVLDFRSQEPLEALVETQDDDGNDNDNDNNRKPKVTTPTDETKLAGLWEISMLLKHHHPSVGHFAQNMGYIEYPGDPLKDFALTPFLDKFAYRNPKSIERIENKLEQTRKSVAARRIGTESLAERKRALPVNDPSFLERSNVAVEDEFFHQFFSERAKRDKRKGIARGPTAGADADEDFEAAEDFAMDQAESKDFEMYEQNWDTDEEEEAFVDNLAQKIIEDSIEENGLGPDDLDAEDPDTADWGDLHDEDDDDDNDEGDKDHEESDDEGRLRMVEDVVSVGSSGSDLDVPPDAGKSLDQGDHDDGHDDGHDDDAFMEDDSSDNSDDPEGLEGEGTLVDSELKEKDEDGDDDEQGKRADLALLESDDSDSSGEDDLPPTPPTKKKKKKAKDQPLYASATEFEEQINQEWYKMVSGDKAKPTETETFDDEDQAPPQDIVEPSSGSKKKKKRKRKSNK